MRVLQINSTVNTGSTGRIAEDIGRLLISLGHESFIAYGRTSRESSSQTYRIGSTLDNYSHVFVSRVFDRHGFASQKSTLELVKYMDRIKPDVIQLHNLHGYYINLPILFNYLHRSKIPVVWFLHDCWAFTGHCTYFEYYGCYKWKIHCNKCPKLSYYPKSLWLDNSYRNFAEKKTLFSSVSNLIIVTPSDWLKNLVGESFLSEKKIVRIHNGVDLEVFKPYCHGADSHPPYVLGVANVWSELKGFKDFLELRNILPEEIDIVLVGLPIGELRKLPKGIRGVPRTESVQELAQYYSQALCFINPTYEDNFPTTNIEALACGTPVITYDTGGSSEAVDSETGIVVSKGDINGLAHSVNKIMEKDRNYWKRNCRQRAETFFDKNKQYMKCVQLYEQMLS
ncbi:MAG: glycosyltransferase [Bacteroidales bacterium]